MDKSLEEENVGIMDIFFTLRHIMVGEKSKDRKAEEDKYKDLQEIYRVEKNIGATDAIDTLVGEIQRFSSKINKENKGTINKREKIGINIRNKEQNDNKQVQYIDKDENSLEL